MEHVTYVFNWLKNNEPVVALNIVAAFVLSVALLIRDVTDRLGPEHGWLVVGWAALVFLQRYLVSPKDRVQSQT